MQALLNSSRVFGLSSSTGYVFSSVWDATPGNAINTFKFLKTNNLIGTTRIDTIGRVLDWARNNLEHFNGTFYTAKLFLQLAVLGLSAGVEGDRRDTGSGSAVLPGWLRHRIIGRLDAGAPARFCSGCSGW